jgi:aldehyde dehydrogenase (NAD+)
MWGKIVNCGQTCIAPDYVLVHKKVADKFIAALKASIPILVPDLPNSDLYSRISCKRHFDRLKTLLDVQLAVPGTKVLTGGKSDGSTLFIEPTILTGVGLDPSKNPIMKDEIFGPILPVIVVESIQEAIDYVNSRLSSLM